MRYWDLLGLAPFTPRNVWDASACSTYRYLGSFSRLNATPLDGETTFGFFTLCATDIWVVPMFWPDCEYCCCAHSCTRIGLSMCFQFFGVYFSSCDLLGHMVILLHLSNRQTFPQRLLHFTFPLATYEGSNFSTFSPILIFHCLIIATLLSVKWYLVVWTGISLVIDTIFSRAWPFVCLLWRCVYSNPVPL